MELMPDIHQIEGVTCNVYLIVEPDGLTLVDSGMPGAQKRILAAVQALGHAPRDVRRILLTHQHIDHVGGAPALVKLTGAEVYAPVGDTPAIEGKAPREKPGGMVGMLFTVMSSLMLRPTRVTRQMLDGETLPVFANEGGLRVVATPGHTAGHVSFYLPSRKLLFAGDAIRHDADGKVAPPPPLFTHDTPQAMRSVAALAALEIEASLPGHGAPILTGAGAQIARLAQTAPQASGVGA